MVSFNTTVSSLSPLLLFVPQALWSLSGNTGAGENVTSSAAVVSNSSQGSAMVLLQFTGTGFWIYGNSSSTSLDSCSVIVDGTQNPCATVPQEDPYDNNSTSLLLYNGSSLASGLHTIQLINPENPVGNVVALDHVKFESTISGANMTKVRAHGANLSDSYHGDGWSKETHGSIANTPTASVTYNFTGQTIALYGPTSNSSSPFLVMVDGWDPTAVMPNARLSSSNASSALPVLLYFNNKLSPGSHTITVLNNPVSGRDELGVSHFEVTNISGDNNSLSLSLIILPIFGAFLLVGGVTLFVYCRRRRRRLAKIRKMMDPHPFWELSRLPNVPHPTAQPHARTRVPLSMHFNVADDDIGIGNGVEPGASTVYASLGRLRYKPPQPRSQATEGVVHIGEARNRPAGGQLHHESSHAGLLPVPENETRARQSDGGTHEEARRKRRRRRRKATSASMRMPLPLSSLQARSTGVARRVPSGDGDGDDARAQADDGAGTMHQRRPLPTAPATTGQGVSLASTPAQEHRRRYRVYRVPVIELPPPYDRGHLRL